ncbi:hypothetical protein [Photobacterium atrarenae]|uniref:Uncharacterized protein n=1 Tax=Photobacterium atrarenae TaxID=865757 RepID=A0ABY5GM11_9GAMM|nr:hypothetical protein [Photobacterium atrarenae]UTV29754.1 hypothetical protein NNL38_22360 [Photobacterium atrarenae]
MVQQELLVTFALIWLGLSVGSFMLFQRGEDAARKRRLWPAYTIFSNTVIGAMLIYMQPPTLMLLGLLAFMVPLTWLTIRATKFCSRCARATRTPFFLKPATKCSHCQKSFND